MLEETIKTIVKEAVRESIQEEIKRGTSYKEQDNYNEVMTTKQLAEYLQCSLPWLTKNIKELNIPYKKLGKEYRFVRSAINSWLIQQNILKREKLNGIAVWVGEKTIMDIGTPEYTTLAFIQDLFNDPTLDGTVLNEENIQFNYGFGYFEIELLEDAINRDLFWELDHPEGLYGGNGDGIYRKDVAVDLSIFNNHLGLASESTAESFKMKFATNYIYGLPDYEDVIHGTWQTAEQRAIEIDPVRQMPTYEAFFTNSNTLRIESNQPIYFFDGPMWAEVDKALLLAQLFGLGEDPSNISDKFNLDNIGITMEDTAFEVQLFSGVFDSEFFWNLDHPEGIDTGYDINPYPLESDGNGVYRRLNTLDFSIFYNSLGDYVEETVDYYLKLYVSFENGIGNYEEPVQAIWQTVEQKESETDPVIDNTHPMFIGITSYPTATEGVIWVDEGEIVEIQISALDENIRRVKLFADRFNTEYGYWYYADSDVYNGLTDADSAGEQADGITVTYADETWNLNLGPFISANISTIDFQLDFEDYAGNKWSDVETDILNREFVFVLSRLDKTELNEVKEYVNTLNPADYTSGSWNTLLNVLDTMPETTQEEIDEKVVVIGMVILDLVPYIAVQSVEIDSIDTNIVAGQTYDL